MKKTFILLFFVFTITTIYSANVNVEELKIIADGYFLTSNNTKFQMNTYFKFVTSFDGGYKFAARVAFETTTKQLETNLIQSTFGLGSVYLFFKDAEVRIKNLAQDHLDISFWTGTHKYLGYGNRYKGYMYYPETSDLEYSGFYRLRGTGISAEIKFWEERFKGEFHFYQNTNFISLDPNALNYFSFDSQVGLYFKNVYIELFGGYTKEFIYPNDDASADMKYGRGKIGAALWVGNEYIDFYTAFGVPNIDTTVSNFNFNSFYLMGELNFKIFIAHNTISFMAKPNLYNEISKSKREEDYDFDLNYRLHIKKESFPLSGGLLFNLKYSMQNSNNYSINLSPFLSVIVTGVEWELHVNYDFGKIQTGNYIDGLRIILGATSKF